MVRYAVLLRAVNLGGATQLPMAEFARVLTGLGYGDVRTLLQSGNAVVTAPKGPTAAMERAIEGALEARFGRAVDVFVRSEAEWTAIREQNPFPREAEATPGWLVVTPLKAAPAPAAWTALREAVVGRERTAGRGREAYLVYPDGIGSSKLTALRIEKALGTRGTSRNWNTMAKIADALAAPAGRAGSG